MDRYVNHDDLIEALGAYALDAMDPDEAEAVRRHLDECPRCAEEVAQHHQVAALLGNTGGEAPAHLWDEIAGKLEGAGHLRARAITRRGARADSRPRGAGVGLPAPVALRRRCCGGGDRAAAASRRCASTTGSAR